MGERNRRGVRERGRKGKEEGKGEERWEGRERRGGRGGRSGEGRMESREGRREGSTMTTEIMVEYGRV